MHPIYIINGAPATGKSTLSRALMIRFEKGLHIPVDDLREFVVSGIAHPMDWNDETIRQFRLAEHAAIDLAIRYQDAGFAVAVDHCRRLEAWDEVLTPRLEGRRVAKIVLQCSLETNLQRNYARTSKGFDPAELDGIIRELSSLLPESQRQNPGWHVVKNEEKTIEEVADLLLAIAHESGR